jgi:hypothetical protein
VIGQIEKAEAKLSADRTNVFSEFAVRVTQTLKNGNPLAPLNGQLLTIERHGGVVRFGNGATVDRGNCYQKMPVARGTYLLFLKNQPATEDFHLMTGYEIRNGAVVAIDGQWPENETYQSQYVQYNGLKLEEFLLKIKAGLTHEAGKGGNQ